jgi:hypothetical protein
MWYENWIFKYYIEELQVGRCQWKLLFCETRRTVVRYMFAVVSEERSVSIFMVDLTRSINDFAVYSPFISFSFFVPSFHFLFLYFFVPSPGSRSQAHATLTCWGRSHDAMRLCCCRGPMMQALHRLQTVRGRTPIKAPPPTQLQRVICKLISTIWAMKIKGACNLRWKRSTTLLSSPLNQATANMCALPSSAISEAMFVWTIRLKLPPTYLHHWQYSPFWAITFLRKFHQIASRFRNNISFFRDRSSHLRLTPNLEDHVSVFMSLQWHAGPCMPPGTGFLLHRLLRL